MKNVLFGDCQTVNLQKYLEMSTCKHLLFCLKRVYGKQNLTAFRRFNVRL